MRLDKAPIPSNYTLRHADGWLTAVNALMEAKAMQIRRRRPVVSLLESVARTYQTFEGAAKHDFFHEMHHQPSPGELDAFCRRIVWLLTTRPDCAYPYLRPSEC